MINLVIIVVTTLVGTALGIGAGFAVKKTLEQVFLQGLIYGAGLAVAGLAVGSILWWIAPKTRPYLARALKWIWGLVKAPFRALAKLPGFIFGKVFPKKATTPAPTRKTWLRQRAKVEPKSETVDPRPRPRPAEVLNRQFSI